MTIQKISGDDIIVWPDGTTCYRHDLGDFGHMSDDYIVLPAGSAEWEAQVEKTNAA